jgi:hypothetical protein
VPRFLRTLVITGAVPFCAPCPRFAVPWGAADTESRCAIDEEPRVVIPSTAAAPRRYSTFLSRSCHLYFTPLFHFPVTFISLNI